MAKSEALQRVINALGSLSSPPGVTWAQRRAGMEAMQKALRLPTDVGCDADMAYGVPVEWITTPDVDPDRVVFYLHGGGFTLGSIRTHRFLMQAVGRAAGAKVLGVDYRLAPEHPFPAAVEDSERAWKWLLEQGVEASRCAIAGDSAGGGLTLATLLKLRDEGLPLPSAAIGLSPWVDLSGSGDSFATKAGEDPLVTVELLRLMGEAYLGGAHPHTALASPLFADLAGLPPLLIQVGTAEILLSDSTRLAERAEAAGVAVTLETWEDMIHVFQAFPTLAESGQAIGRIGDFVRQHTAS